MIKSGNKWHAAVDRRGCGNKQDFIPLFFFIYVYILWQGQKAVPTIVEIEFVDIFYSKFQLVLTFSICSEVCVENWFLCCYLSFKWVTCRCGCKRFWKSAFIYSISIWFHNIYTSLFNRAIEHVEICACIHSFISVAHYQRSGFSF